MLDKYPMSEFYIEEKPCSINYATDLIFKYKKAVLMRIALWGVELNNKLWGAPYLSRDKCRHVVNGVYDNGRILQADYLETTLTDIDFKILLDEYNFIDSKIIKIASAKYGYLPRQIRDLNIELYKRKTELKGVEGQEIYYMKSKNLLNSIYGMSVQKPVKQNIIYENGVYRIDNQDEEDILNKTYRKAFLSYAWGVWTTANARYRLEQAIKHVGNAFVYCDTYSCKYI